MCTLRNTHIFWTAGHRHCILKWIKAFPGSKHTQGSSLLSHPHRTVLEKHGTIMLILLRNNPAVIHHCSVVYCAPCTRWPTLGDSHNFLSHPFKPSQSFSSPLNPVSCLPLTLFLNVYIKSVTQPQAFRSFSLFSLMPGLSPPPLPPSCPLPNCLSIVREIFVQTNRERRYPPGYLEIGLID